MFLNNTCCSTPKSSAVLLRSSVIRLASILSAIAVPFNLISDKGFGPLGVSEGCARSNSFFSFPAIMFIALRGPRSIMYLVLNTLPASGNPYLYCPLAMFLAICSKTPGLSITRVSKTFVVGVTPSNGNSSCSLRTDGGNTCLVCALLDISFSPALASFSISSTDSLFKPFFITLRLAFHSLNTLENPITPASINIDSSAILNLSSIISASSSAPNHSKKGCAISKGVSSTSSTTASDIRSSWG